MNNINTETGLGPALLCGALTGSALAGLRGLVIGLLIGLCIWGGSRVFPSPSRKKILNSRSSEGTE